MKVRFTYLDRQHASLKSQLSAAIDGIFERSAFILRPEVDQFERRASQFLGVNEVIGVNSGTDALYLGMKAIDLPDGAEVITVGHTFISSIGAIAHAGLKPILVDVGDDYNIDPDAVEDAVTASTKAILVVHMNGRLCRMDRIEEIAKRHDLFVLEDAAQAIGAHLDGRHAGAFGTFAAFSLHPMKVLGAAGDAGFVSTNDRAFADSLRMLRNIGQRERGVYETFGYNSRLDTLQAAICLVKFDYLETWVERRRQLARHYNETLNNLPGIQIPPSSIGTTRYDAYSSYVIRSKSRDALRESLASHGIETMVSWSPPLHQQHSLGLSRFELPKTERISGEILSLPIDPFMTDQEQDYVIETITNLRR